MTGQTNMGLPESIPGLANALRLVAPKVDQSIWLVPLSQAMLSAKINTKFRISAFLGQCLVEAGPDFGETSENLFYTTASRLVAIWPSRFASEADAQPYLRNPEKLANRVYSNKLGNKDEASGGGWRYRGGGLLQLTGFDEYAAFGKARGMTPQGAVAWVRTPSGAADAAAWYWESHGCNELADEWQLSAITKAINGAGMVGAYERIAWSNRLLKTFG